MKTKILLVFLCLLSYVLPAQTAGELDLSFANVGYRVDVTSDTVQGCILRVMPDGRIVTGAVSNDGPDRRVRIFRYLADGQLDTTLAHTGTMRIPGPIVQSDYISMELQPDGKLLVYYQAPASLDGVNAVGRLNVDGSLDASFGVGGWVIDSSTYPVGYPVEVMVQSDGKILLAGVYDDLTTGFYGQRLLANGTFDLSYGSAGTGLVPVPINIFSLNTHAATLQADGKLLIVGSTHDTITPGNNNAVLGRLNTDGSVDAGFGTGGYVWDTQSPISQFTFDVGLGLLGEIFVLGENPTSMVNAEVNLLQYSSAGVLNTSFGTGGCMKITDPTFDMYATGIEMQSDGSILILCIGADINHNTEVPNLIHLLPNFSRDPAFGINGIARPILNNQGLSGDDLALQADGKIVVAGTSEINWKEDHMTVARYHGSLSTGVSLTVGNSNLVELFPNPHAGLSQLRLTLAAAAEVSVRVTDLLGRTIALPVTMQALEVGVHTFPVDASHLAGGNYLIHVQAGQEVQTLRMVVAR